MNARGVLRALWARLAGSFMPSAARQRADDDLRAELESHLEMHIADNIRRGMLPDEARRDALLAAGGMTVAAEAVRERRGVPAVENVAHDVRHAFRSLVARPAFAIAVILTLALGIGANTAMFSVVDAVVLHPLPYPQAERVLSLSEAVDGEDQGVVTDHTYLRWEPSAKTVAIAAYRPERDVLVTSTGAEELPGRDVRPAYPRIIGVAPLLGRNLGAADFRADAPRVMVLSEQLWHRTFGGDPSIVGRTVTLADQPVSVVGVLRAAATTDVGPQYWTPFRIEPSEPGATYYWFVVARLRDGATLAQARAELGPLTPQAPGAGSSGKGVSTPVVMTLADRQFGDQRKPLLLLFGAVAVLLFIACSNLANLALIRAAGRQREFAIRLTLGAGRWRLASSLLSESLMLALTGGVLGLALSVGLVKYFVHLSPKSVGNPERIHVNGLVLAFTMLLAIASGLAFGLAPVFFAWRGDLSRALSSGTPRASAGGAQQMLRRVLVVGQLATALILLTGAGLVARSFWRVTSTDLGFRPDRLISVAPRLSSAYCDERAATYFAELLARVRRLPSVERAAFGGNAPLSGITGSYATRDSAGHQSPQIDMVLGGPGFFRAIGARLVAGREFTGADGPRAALVAVVNEKLARRLYPSGGAVGRTMAGPNGKTTIIGVVANIRHTIERQPAEVVYVSLVQHPIGSMVLLVRTKGAPSAAEAAIGAIVRSMDRTLPPPRIERLDDIVAKAVAPRAFVFVLLALFAGIAAMLAVIGLYGVLSRVVTERTREIGIRIALGAERGRVVRAVLGQGFALAMIGVVLGLGASVASVRLMRSLVYQTSIYDPWAFTAGAALLVSVSLLASYLPARRATRIDPVAALREE